MKPSKDHLFSKAINEENRNPVYLKGLKIYKVPRAIANDPNLKASPNLIEKAVGEVKTHD